MLFVVLALLSLALLAALLLIRLWLVMPRDSCEGRKAPANAGKFKCLVVLGSGGHTTEMIYDLSSLGSLRERIDITYIIADTDRGSAAQAEAFEKECGSSGAKIVRVPRAREVGQSYASSILTTLNASRATLQHVLGLRPDIVFTNGPGTCVPVVFAAYVCRVLGLRRTAVIYSESFACVEHLSLSGRILYRFADRFTVQWPHLLRLHARAQYAGRLYNDADLRRMGDGPLPAAPLEALCASAQPNLEAVAIVTVGSTKFDVLIAAIDCLGFLEVLKGMGIRRLKVQKGNGACPSVLQGSSPEVTGVEVEVFDYRPNLAAELRRAALVVSHAGAGTILDCLLAARRMVVVPNEGLMANHQVQLGMSLQDQNLLLCLRARELVEGLRRASFGMLRRFPERSSPAFARCARELLGVAPGASERPAR